MTAHAIVDSLSNDSSESCDGKDQQQVASSWDQLVEVTDEPIQDFVPTAASQDLVEQPRMRLTMSEKRGLLSKLAVSTMNNKTVAFQVAQEISDNQSESGMGSDSEESENIAEVDGNIIRKREVVLPRCTVVNTGGRSVEWDSATKQANNNEVEMAFEDVMLKNNEAERIKTMCNVYDKMYELVPIKNKKSGRIVLCVLLTESKKKIADVEFDQASYSRVRHDTYIRETLSLKSKDGVSEPIAHTPDALSEPKRENNHQQQNQQQKQFNKLGELGRKTIRKEMEEQGISRKDWIGAKKELALKKREGRIARLVKQENAFVKGDITWVELLFHIISEQYKPIEISGTMLRLVALRAAAVKKHVILSKVKESKKVNNTAVEPLNELEQYLISETGNDLIKLCTLLTDETAGLDGLLNSYGCNDIPGIEAFSRIPLRKVLAYLWALSMRDRQALVHMLNGNTQLTDVSFLDGDLWTTRSDIAIINVAETKARLVLNQSTRTLRWQGLRLTLFDAAVTPTLNTICEFVLVIVLDGSVPPDFFFAGFDVFTNTNTVKWLMTDQLLMVNLEVRANTFAFSGFVYLPPGAALWMMATIPAIIPASGVVVATLQLQKGLFPMQGLNIIQAGRTVVSHGHGRGRAKKSINKIVEQKNIESTGACGDTPDTITLDILGKRRVFSGVGSFLELQNLLFKLLPTAAGTYYLQCGVKILQDWNFRNLALTLGQTIRVKFRLPGGMLNAVEALEGSAGTGVTVNTIINPSVSQKISKTSEKLEKEVVQTTSDTTISNDILSSLADRIVSLCTTREADSYVGGTYVSWEQVMYAWSKQVRIISEKTNDIGGTVIMPDFREGIWGSGFMPSSAIPGGPIEQWVSVGQVSNTRNDRQPKVQLCSALNVLDMAMKTGDLITQSQTVRINTSMASGDAFQRILSEASNRYSAGMGGSASSILLKLYLYALCQMPLPACEGPYITSNLHPAVRPFSRTIGTTWWPLSTNLAIAPVLGTRIIDMNLFSAIRAGTNTNPIPIGFELETWGSSTALIGIAADMANKPQQLASWILAHMEYPFVTSVYAANYVGDAGLPSVLMGSGATPVVPAAARKIVYGPKTKILLVVTNLFSGVAGSDISVQVGAQPVISIITLQANGFAGVEFDLTPALDAALEDIQGTLVASLTVTFDWWRRYYGGISDAKAAMIVAADCSVVVGQFGVAGVGDTIFSSQVADRATAPWRTVGYDDPTVNRGKVEGASLTSPWCFTDANNAADMRAMPTRFMTAPDYIACVDLVAGVITYSNKIKVGDGLMPATVLGLACRCRFLSRAMTTFMDAILINSRLSGSELFNPLRIPSYPGSPMSIPVSGIGYSEITNVWRYMYKGINKVLARLDGDLPVFYIGEAAGNNHVDSYSAPYPVSIFGLRKANISPSRSPMWYIKLVSENDKIVIPSTFIQKRLVTKVNVLSDPVTGNRWEVLPEYRMNGVGSTSVNAYAEAVGTVVATYLDPTLPRIGWDLSSSIVAGFYPKDIYATIDRPSMFVARLRSMNNFEPPNNLFTEIVDLPTHLPPCLRSANESSDLIIMLGGASRNYARWSRTDNPIFKTRVIMPDIGASVTQEVTDMTSPDAYKTDMGF